MSMMESNGIKFKMQTEKPWFTFRNILLSSICFLVLISFTGMIRTMIYELRTTEDIPSFKKYTVNNTLTVRRHAIRKGSSGMESSVLCPEIPPNLIGPITVNTSASTYEEIEKRYPWVERGGRYQPSECVARRTIAIIIPFRNRGMHLRILLNNLHPFLRKQQVNYRIFVINQDGWGRFNKAMMMNVGFKEALKMSNYSCFIFHDVDLLPEDDRNIYGCFGNPRHLAAAIDKFNYSMPYDTYFGGATAFSRSEYEKVNGHSNLFFGWGCEDDDIYNRVIRTKQKIDRYSMQIAKYKMIQHNRDKGNEENVQRDEILKKGNMTMAVDGLNSLVYKLKNIDIRKLYTWISVQINTTDVMQDN